ncbi:hypothetical protein OS493_016734 [Desmophyllum pertusum]|uniref:Uncharacterized protein n=1 Tax=Desmophyllum pertusum TaxID=174260 RepID=A0A9X0CIH1_9CNID|nr:hypothetical protein OS493_025039 [Desmophyllum pertusum]KAJ7353825.1 hypothetical protein OS493_032099 [Desmophyllum pertusum]KAJ7372814.1 hypothetical protein OS493_016734 [Desmophyllum pertusum]
MYIISEIPLFSKQMTRKSVKITVILKRFLRPHHALLPSTRSAPSSCNTSLASMDSSLNNVAAIEKFKYLVELSYKERVNGKFKDCTATSIRISRPPCRRGDRRKRRE